MIAHRELYHISSASLKRLNIMTKFIISKSVKVVVAIVDILSWFG